MSFLASLFPKRRTGISLAASSPSERAATFGLIQVSAKVSAVRPMSARLRVFVGREASAALDKTLELGPEPHEFWFALHSHLLPNGPSECRLVLDAKGATLATHRMTLHVANEGETARRVRESLAARATPLVLDGVCDSGLYDYADPTLTAWFDRDPENVEAHLAQLAATGQANDDELEALRHFVDNGYLVVPDAIDTAHLDRLNAAVDDAVAKKVEGYDWGSSQRLHNLHQTYPAIHELWRHPRVMRLLALIFDGPAQPCQSLTYVFGSQQEHHQDTIHLTPFPAGRMCGVWTALEDVQPDSGELMVFPGSHRLPRVYTRTVGAPKVRGEDWTAFRDKVVHHWTAMINGAGLGPVAYRPKAGTILIWHENLMHAGSPRKDLSKSRRSIVGHYFARGAVVYYDSSGLPAVLTDAPAG